MTSDPFAGRPAEPVLVRLSRAQRVAVALSVLLAIVALLDSRARIPAVVAAVVLGGTAMGSDGRAVIDRAQVVLAFWSRPRWTRVDATLEGRRLTVRSRVVAHCTLAVVPHRGRLDLSGGDHAVAGALVALADRLAAVDGPRALSWRTTPHGSEVATVVAVPEHLEVPLPLRPVDPATASALVPDLVRAGWRVERWRYVRDARGVSAVFAVRATPSTSGATPLGILAPFGSGFELCVIVSVGAMARARAVAGRHAHRWRADTALAAALGFRRRATFAATEQALDRREADVAAGRALARASVLVVVHATTPRELEERAAVLRASARASGVALVRGDGRHGPWLRAALPGSPA